ncbi:MAG TPA: MFS transporter [Caldilineaceae bacterium]|nr:MFS transporter [Caldilineaceae bacterium]
MLRSRSTLPAKADAPAARAGWLVASVGSVIGLSIMGDSLLYSVLPLAAPALGLTLPQVGVLLSANRLVRLLSNAWAGRIYERLGPRRPFLGAVLVGLVATLLYGLAAGFVLFLAARLLWGIAWSGLRQGGYQAVWTGAPAIKGRLTGLLWGLVRLGSAISVMAGGLLYDRYGYSAAVAMAIGAAMAAAVVALAVQWRMARTEPDDPPEEAEADAAPVETAGPWRLTLVRPVQRWLTVASFFEYLLSGIVVSTTAIFVAQQATGAGSSGWGLGVATITGMLHGVRWLSDLGLGPVVGAISDHIGQDHAAAAVGVILVAALVGAVTLPPLAALVCLFVVLLCDGALHVVMSAAASGAALTSARPHAFIGVYTTTSDAGSALGPLVAYSLAVVVGLPALYFAGGACLALALGQYWRAAQQKAAA